MSQETKQPHVEFSMSDSPITAALQSLGIGDESSRRDAAQGQSWPTDGAWEAHRIAHAGLLHRPLAEDLRDAIETLLGSVEKGFAAWLAAGASDAATLRQLSAELAGAEALITAGEHRTFPYFSRYFLLESALFGQRMALGDASGADQLAKVKLWWRSRSYLQAAFQGAYAERSGEIVVRVTGALKDRLYVEDTYTRTALTSDVVAGGQDEIELRRVREYLASEAAWQYIRDLQIEEGASILAQAHATITVTANSRIRQEQLVDASKFWPEQQEAIEAEIAANREACGLAIERLVIRNEWPAEPLARAEALVRAPEYWGYLEILIPGVIGCIPVVGAAVGAVYGAYLKFLGGLLYPQAPDPLIEFEKKMEAMVFDKIADADAKWINNMLKGIEGEIEKLFLACKDQPPSIFNDPALKIRAIKLYQEVHLNKHHLLDPASGSYYKVAPYYRRFFICFLVAAELAEKFGDRRDFRGERKTLYNDTNLLVYHGVHGMCAERRDRIRIKNTSNGCNSDIQEVYDYRVDKKYSSDLRKLGPHIHHSTVACQWAAGMATAIQHMREMTCALDDYINRDTAVTNTSASGFKPNTVGNTFSGALGYIQGQVWSGYEMLRRSGITHVVNADVGKMEGASSAQLKVTETQFPGKTIFTI